MSEERKSIKAGKLVNKNPDKRLLLTIKEQSVKTEHIADNAITSSKVSPDAVEYITEDVQNQIDSIQIGGWAISNQLGNDPHIGISQKALTELIGYDSVPDSIRGRIQIVENEIGTDTTSDSLSGRITNLENAVGTGGSIDTRISTVKSDIIGTASSDYDTLGETENKIKDEVTNRTNAVNALDGRISNIEPLIPFQATSSNQLADKNFVNSAISTATAVFKGTFNSLAELQEVADADANDYAYVISTDSAGNTLYNRYKFVGGGTGWVFEYALNNSSFTAQEWATIESGMTEALTTKLSALPNNAVLQNTLTTLSNTDISLGNRIIALETNVGEGGSVDARINLAKAQIIGDADANYNTLGKLEYRLQEEATARENAVTTEKNRAEAAEEALRNAVGGLTQSDIIIGALPETGQASTIYRVPGTNSYSDYSWDGSQFVLMATYNNAIDDVPTVGSDNLVKSNAVNGELGELTSEIFNPIDLYTLTPQDGIILANGAWSSGNTHLIFPLDGIKRIVFKSYVDYGTIVAFLKTYDTTAASADFSADYPSRFTVPSGYTRIYDVPSDANYFYVVNKVSGYNDLRAYEKIWMLTGDESAETIINERINANIPRGIVVIKNKTVSVDAPMYPTDVHITSSSTHDIVCMKIDEGVTKIIPVNATIGRFRFFNTYNKVDAASYISTTDISSGAVPDGAQYVIMVAAHDNNPDGLDNLIIRTEPNTNDIVGAFEKMMGNETEQIDLSNLPDFGYIIQSDNKYHPTGGTAKGRVIALPLFASYIEIEANENASTVFALLENTTVDADMIPNFADNNEMRYVIPAGGKARYRLNPSCKYLYFSKTSTGGVDMTPTVTVEYTMGGGEAARKQLGVLFIGSSGEQDMMGYVPPILKEVLYDYDITFGDMYYSGAQADNYVNFYKNDTPCSIFNLWSPDSVSWTRMSGMVIEEVLELQKWDLILIKGSDTGCRQLMRIIQSLVSYPVCFATVANIPRVYDNQWEDVIEAAKQRCKNVGFIGWVPVGTAMQNARSNDVLKMTGGISCPEPTEFTIPAGRFFAFQHRIRKSTASIQVATIKATRLSGTGEVKIYAGETIASNDYLLLTMNDAVEHTTTFNNNTNYIKIVNSGNNDVTVKFENTQANGDYLLFTDNQHTQSGIPTLISSYTIALKIMEWTGNAARGINAASFIPTSSEITSIGAADASGYGNGLGHGYSCGVDNYIGTDGNYYDRSQLTLFDDTLYVTKTVFDNTPDANSVSAVLDENDPIKYINVYAAQEVATLAVNYPDVESDCSGVVIEVPQKN